MNLDEYTRTERRRFAGLARVVADILAAALAQEGSLRPQQIQHRAKSVPSLTRKLESAGVLQSDDIEAHAKDLAGVRLVFYSNADVARFQSSRLLVDNFDVDWERTKFHHPTSDSPSATDLFQSNNYVIKLKTARADLPEYAPFTGLSCEVQVQTTLNHAWAETAHDTIYKKPAITGFGGRLMEGIEARMKAIMQNYLIPAGYEFQKVLSDFERLSDGKELFERGMLSAIATADSNEALHDVLAKIESHLSDLDDPQDVARDLIGAVVVATQRANATPPHEVASPFGLLPGKDAVAVNEAAASLVSALSLQDVDAAFKAICDLRLNAPLEEAAQPWIEAAENLSRPNLHLWQQVGPHVQEVMLDVALGFTEEKRLALRDVILAVVENALSLELEATTSGAESIQLHRGTPVFSADLARVRAKAIGLINEYEGQTTCEPDRRRLLRAYTEAMRYPPLGAEIENGIAAMVLQDAARVIRRLAPRCAVWPFELRQSFEHVLLWQFRHYGSSPPQADAKDAVQVARHDMVDAIDQARNLLEGDRQYFVYKVLVGFDSVFPPSWQDSSWELQFEDAYRNERIDEFVASISQENKHEWRKTIDRCTATQSNDLATFIQFQTFLERLAAQRAPIVLEYLLDDDNVHTGELMHFLAPLCRGLSRTPEWPASLSWIETWISQGRFLADVVFMGGRVAAVPVHLFVRAVDRAIEDDDFPAVFNAFPAIAARESASNGDDLGGVFISAVRYMAARKESRWVNGWFVPQGGSRVIDQLDGEGVKDVLATLVSLPQIDFRAERLLSDVARNHPGQVLEYFESRLRGAERDDLDRRYGAIPLGLPTLAPVLAPHIELVVSAGLRWYGQQPELFSYRGGKFIQNIYPQFGGELEAELRRLTSQDDGSARFAVEVARAYSGQTALHPLLRDVVASGPSEDVLSAVSLALQPTGISHGRFGRFDKLQVVRTELASWLEDARPRVQAFANREIRLMDLTLAAERRRAEDDIAMRRLEHGEPPG